MKLSEAIEYATRHEKFLAFLRQKNIDPNSAHQIIANISNVSDEFVENRIYIDFGVQGQSGDFADIDHYIPREADHRFRLKLTR